MSDGYEKKTWLTNDTDSRDWLRAHIPGDDDCSNAILTVSDGRETADLYFDVQRDPDEARKKLKKLRSFVNSFVAQALLACDEFEEEDEG